MTSFIKDIQFNLHTGIIYIKGESSVQISEQTPHVMIRERMEADCLALPNSFEIQTNWNEQQFSFTLNLQEAKKIVEQGQIWDFQFIVDEEKHLLDISRVSNYETSYYSSEGSLHTIALYTTKSNTLAIFVRPKQVKYGMTNMKLDEQTLKCSIEIDQQIAHSIKECRLKFKRKESEAVRIHRTELTVQGEKTKERHYCFTIPKDNIFTQDILRHGDSWEAFIEFSDGECREISTDFIIEKNAIDDRFTPILSSPLFKSVFTLNGNGQLHIKINKVNIDVRLHQFSYQDNGVIGLQGTIKSMENVNQKLQAVQLYLRPKDNLSLKCLTPYTIELPFNETEGSFYSEFSLQDLFKHQRKLDQTGFDVQILLQDKKTGCKGEYDISLSSLKEKGWKYQSIGNGFEIKPYTTKISTLALWMKKVKSVAAKDPVKIAVYGSCYSRAAFNSQPYFNPDYKEKYKVVYTQFHSNTISTMSNPIEYKEAYFRQYNEAEKGFIQDDFEKTFFQRISQTAPEFLIIDFYSDVFLDLAVINNKHIITGNYFLRGSQYLYDVSGSVEFINRKNMDSYLIQWRDAMERFSAKIKEYLPEERIILQKARSIGEFYSKSGGRQKFSTPTEQVDFNNYLYEYMERYFLQLMPKAQIIDVTNYGFIGHETYPDGNSINHYEPSYYKELMKQLDHIVIRTTANEYKVKELTR